MLLLCFRVLLVLVCRLALAWLFISTSEISALVVNSVEYLSKTGVLEGAGSRGESRDGKWRN